MSPAARDANAPETPRKRGGRDFIEDRVQQLRDEFDLNITPRQTTYSPTQQNNYPGDKIYENIKLLHWKENETLHAVIEECRSDFKNPSNGALSSSEQRTHYVNQKLEKAAASVRSRIRDSLDRPKTHSCARTPPRSQHWLRSLQRSDSKTDLQRPSTPISPLGRKSMAITKNTTPENTRDSSLPSGDSFVSNNTTAVTSFTSDIPCNANEKDPYGIGSSWSRSQGPPIEANRNSFYAAVSQSINNAAEGPPEQP